MRIYIGLILISTLLFGRTVIVTGEGVDENRIEAEKKAMQQARAKASEYFKTDIQTHFTKHLQSDGSSKSEYSVIQKSESYLELIGEPKYQYEIGRFRNTILYDVKVTAQFRLIEKSKKKRHIEKLNKRKKPIVKEKYNFQISITNPLPDIDIYLLVVPENQFQYRKFNIDSFPINENYYRKYKKYLYKFQNNRLEKSIPPGKYQIAFLMFDGTFFIRENKFRLIEFGESFKKHYSISIQMFINW